MTTNLKEAELGRDFLGMKPPASPYSGGVLPTDQPDGESYGPVCGCISAQPQT